MASSATATSAEAAPQPRECLPTPKKFISPEVGSKKHMPTPEESEENAAFKLLTIRVCETNYGCNVQEHASKGHNTCSAQWLLGNVIDLVFLSHSLFPIKNCLRKNKDCGLTQKCLPSHSCTKKNKDNLGRPLYVRLI